MIVMKQRLSAVIVAAGTGTRFGSTVPKQFLTLGHLPVLCWSLEAFCEFDRVNDIVVVASADFMEQVEEMVRRYSARVCIKVVAGGDQRQQSVFNGLISTERAIEWVAVHDAARPFVTSDVIEQVFEKALQSGAAVPGMLVQDTIKRVDDSGFVVQNIDRQGLWAIQTPQVCRKNDLLAAYELAVKRGIAATDEAGLLEEAGVQVAVVPSSFDNFKITTPYDFRVAQYLCDERYLVRP